MQIAKGWQMNPRELATLLVQEINSSDAAKRLIEHLEIAGPGFINIRLSNDVKQTVVKEILEQGIRFGIKPTVEAGPVLIEFVSANPTGPLHVGHGRQAALGDILANVIESQGRKDTS
jgi:arginyl-tRNA synthetase